MDVVKIKYEVDDSEIDRLIKKYGTLDKASEELVTDFRAINKEAAKAGAAMTGFGNSAEKATKKSKDGIKDTQKSLGEMNAGANKIAGLIAGYFTFQAITSLGKQIIDATAQFEKFQAVLTNTLGSKALAEATISQITQFAAKTPFDVDQLVGSYVKLANQGFRPTTIQLRQLGDLASSTGKSFDQLTEAIIDAQTGEFERLKEFGIRAQKQGDQVTFTFKGVKTTVDNTSDSIRNYVTGLGDAIGVTGAMAAESATMGGSISNLGDAFGQLSTVIGKILAPAIKGTISLITDLTSALQKSFETIDDQIVKNTADRLTEISQERDDFQKKEIQSLLKQGKSEEEIAKSINERLISQNLFYINQRTRLQDKEIAERTRIGEALGLDKKFFLTVDKFKEALRQLEATGPPLSKEDSAVLENYKAILEDIKVSEFALEDGNNRLTKTYDNIDAAIATNIDANKKLAKANENVLKTQLDNLAKLEQLTIARAKTESATEADILRIQTDFNGRREKLYQRYGKTREIDYQFLLVKEKQLEIDYTDFIQKEEDNRRKARLEARDQILKNIDDQAKRQQDLSTTSYNNQHIEQQVALKKGEITLEQYHANIETINTNAKREELQSAIDADKQKLSVTKLTADQTIAIQKDISDKTKQLNDLEVAEFQKKEDAKTKAAKKAQADRAHIEQQAYNLFVEVINSSYQIKQNKLTADLQNIQSNADSELKLAGDNQKKKDQINATTAEKERYIKRRQAEIDRNQAIFNIGITTALNVVKALGQPPIPGTNVIAAAIAAAAGAAQLAVVLSRPVPKFAKGTKRVTGGSPGVDSVHALLMPDEAVIPSDQAQHPNLKPIIGGLIDRTLDPANITIRGHKQDIRGSHRDEPLLKEMQGLRREIKRLKQVNVTVDKSGVNVDEVSGNSRTRILNNYFND